MNEGRRRRRIGWALAVLAGVVCAPPATAVGTMSTEFDLTVEGESGPSSGVTALAPTFGESGLVAATAVDGRIELSRHSVSGGVPSEAPYSVAVGRAVIPGGCAPAAPTFLGATSDGRVAAARRDGRTVAVTVVASSGTAPGAARWRYWRLRPWRGSR